MTARRWLPMFLLLAACGGGGDERGGRAGRGGWGGGPKPEPVTVVEVADVGTGSVAEVLVSTAVVESERAADLLPQATGVVRSVLVDEGDMVQKGQTLAVLENVTLDAGAERAVAEVEKLERDAAAARALFDKGAISRKELSEAEFQLDNARSRLREARGSAGQTRISAPFFGVVASRDVRVGQLASSGQKAFSVVDPARLRVVAQLPERDLSKVSVGQPAELVSAYDDAVRAAGHVSRIAPVVDPTSGTFRVHIGVDDGTKLRPGQFVSVHLEVDRHEEVVVVPRRAVVYEDGLPVAYRMIEKPPEDDASGEEKPGEADEDDAGGGLWASLFGGSDDAAADEGKGGDKTPEGPVWVAERVPLRLGLVDDRAAEVMEGIELGDDVVVVGQANLREGARVKTPEMIQAEEAEKQAEKSKAEAEGDEEQG